MLLRPSLVIALTIAMPLLSIVRARTALAQDAAHETEAPEAAPDPRRAEDGSPTSPPTDVHPPELLEPIEPEYPPAALPAGIEGTVVLHITIDAEGNVTQASVIESLGHGLDEAAQAAVRKARFKPARKGELNVAARIRALVEFKLPHEAPAPTSPDAPVADETGGGPSTPRPIEPPAPPPPPSRAPEPIEVTVLGQSAAERRRNSAEAVKVIETERARRQSADMGEVLARTQGVGVRRAGGLGSDTGFSLNGLTDDQVRFYLDGVPLELAGYPFGVANVPVNLVDRVEIYSGAVPIRYGADALGGAVNLATTEAITGTHAAASYELGSFHTHRLTLGARHLHEPSGFFSRVGGFFDYSKNDYSADVEVPDERGRLSPARVDRFHDAYRAVGANAEVGFVNRRWARRLLLRAFVTDYDKEFQHNIVMTVPYGAATYSERSTGGTLRYQHSLRHGISIDTLAGYAYTRGRFLDVTRCVYDWHGRCVRERNQPGETDTRPHDQLYWDHSAFVRLNLEWRPHPAHALRVALAPTYLTRTGDERRQTQATARDPLTAERNLWTVVNGFEYEVDLFDDQLENIAFAKQYLQLLHSEEPRPGGIFRERDRETHRFGAGDALRYRFTSWLYAKLSYEYATRLPRPDEIFGDNKFIIANLQLEPERSHNGNLGITFDLPAAGAGEFRGTVNGFLRDAEELIVLLGNDRVQSNQNVYGARSLGVETAAGWTSPGDYLWLDANVTYQDFRNTSDAGTFGDFVGDRIPNRPYLFGFASARLQFSDVIAARDELSLFWSSRYVHEYFRGWESVGLVEFKQVIDAQLVHGAGLGYFIQNDRARLSTSVEAQNVSDEAVFDFFGVQRPGRAFYWKTTAEF